MSFPSTNPTGAAGISNSRFYNDFAAPPKSKTPRDLAK